MNFERFDKTNSTSTLGRGAVPSATVHMGEKGTFRFSKLLVEQMGIEEGNGLAFLYDKTGSEWFLQRDDENGIPLRAVKNGGLQLNSSKLVKRVSATLPGEMPSAVFQVAPEPIEVEDIKMWALLTSTAKAPAVRERKPK